MAVCTPSFGVLDSLPPPKEWRWISRYTKGEPGHPQKVDPARPVSQETHASYEVMLCLSGGPFPFGFNGMIHQITPGTVLLIGPDVQHDGEILGPSFVENHPPCFNLWLHLQQPHFLFVNDLQINLKPGEKHHSQRTYLLPNARSFARSVCQVWEQVDRDPTDPFREIQLQQTVSALLIETLYRGARTGGLMESTHHQSVVIDEIKHYIMANLDKKLSLTELSVIAGYTPIYLHRLFARFCGEPIHQFIIRKRVDQAKRLLEQGYKAVVVTEALGFETPSYFCRFFKRETGKTPSEWVAQASQKEA